MAEKPDPVSLAEGSFSSSQQASAHALPEKLLVAGNHPLPELQYSLDKSWGSVGQKQAAAGLNVI